MTLSAGGGRAPGWRWRNEADAARVVIGGLYCLGGCWALMLVLFAVGAGNLAWMAGLTGVMLVEKTTRRGHRLVPLVGLALLASGGLALAHTWLGP